MSRQGVRLIPLLLSLLLTIPSVAQIASSPQPQTNTETSQPVSTLQTFSRMVTLEVVVKDSRGKHITGLNANDFRVFEQTPSRGREKREQKIAAFREVQMAELASEVTPEVQMPPGTYSNLITQQKDPIPPTILLVDGLNTEPQYQAQIHVQMLRMLRSLPANVPIAVFLLGGDVQKVQDFTTDPRLLQIALSHVISTAGVGIATVDPRDDPFSPSNLVGSLPHAPALMVEQLKGFDMKIYAANMDMRVNRTINALNSIARHVAGYPGRKNLLWLSTAFPIALNPASLDGEIDKSAGYRNYWERLQELNGSLSDAKVAVYPINVAGVRAPDAYKASAMPVAPMADTMNRESMARSNEQDAMLAIADGTGGKICTGNNDLGDCVHKAVDDSSDFYEIAYYPDAQNWNGEFRRIILNTESPGAHLAYRQGYFANPAGSPDPKYQATKLQSSCEDYLNATSVGFTAITLQPDSPEQLKFGLTISPKELTLTPTGDGDHKLNLAVGVCTFNKKGWVLNLMSYPVYLELDAERYESLMATGHFTQSIFVPGPKPAAVRLLVRDVPSGRLGSVYIKVDDLNQTRATEAAASAH